MLQFPSFDSAIASVPGMGTPEPWQLDQINRFRPKGMPPYKAEDLVSVPMLASHNLMSFSNGVWDDLSLESMAALFPGKPMNLNHEWDDVQKNVGFVYSAYAVQTADAPIHILNAAEYFEVNRSIVANKGFQFLLTYAAFPSDSPAVKAIEFRQAKDVSTGGITDGTMICPLCNGEFFTDECDGHLPPHPMLLFFLGDDDDIEWAPYYIRSGFHTAVELSLCVSGNLPGAEVLSEPMEAEQDPVEVEAEAALQVAR